MDVREALEAAVGALVDFPDVPEAARWPSDYDEDEQAAQRAASQRAIVAFLERVPDFGEATVSANYAERPVNTPSRILAAIREAQS